MGHTLEDLRVGDLLTLLAVQRTGSISVAARELDVTRSQVSKAIARLEAQWRTSLLVRGPRGVSLSDAGRRIVPHIATAVSELRSTTRNGASPEAIQLTVAGPSYLVSYLLPVIARSVPRLRVRGLELAPAHLRAAVAEGVFDMAILPGGIESRTAAWTSDEVGVVRKGLFAAPALAKKLAPFPTAETRVRAVPFVGPMTSSGDRFVAISDDCPIPLEDRIVAHEVQTIGAALELASGGDLLVFGPVVAARRLLRARALVEIPVEGWDTREPLYLLCNGDAVLSRVRTAALEVVAAAMASVDA